MKPSTQSGNYPADWQEVADRIKKKHNYHCERCGKFHAPKEGYTLTVHHLDLNPSNNADWNLAALCQRCHLKVQSYLKMDQLFMPEVIKVSEWFKPHLEGYLKSLALTQKSS